MRLVMISVFLLSMVVSAWTDWIIVAKADQIAQGDRVQITSTAADRPTGK